MKEKDSLVHVEVATMTNLRKLKKMKFPWPKNRKCNNLKKYEKKSYFTSYLRIFLFLY